MNPRTGKLTATLSLPNATGSFKQGGVVPVTATTQFVNDGKTTGKLNLNTGAVRDHVEDHAADRQPERRRPAGFRRQILRDQEPVVVNLKSEANFNVLNGGKVAGTYTIPKFRHCLLATPLINLTIPASGNTITLKLGKAKISRAQASRIQIG